MADVVVVSACLLGLPTRYDGRSETSPEVEAAAGDLILVPVCPEQLGGLPTPRPPHCLEEGRGDRTGSLWTWLRLPGNTSPQNSRGS